MEDILIGIISFAVLVIAGHSAKVIFWDMRQQRALNVDFLKRLHFQEVSEGIERLKELIIARDARVAFEKMVAPSPQMFKIVDCHKTTDGGKEIFFLTVCGFAQPTSLIESVFILAPLKKIQQDPFHIRIWSNTYGPGTSVFKSNKRINALDFGKSAKMNGREIFRSADLPDFEQVDFYGPRGEHPQKYLGSTIFEMVRGCRENGIAEISCLDGLALFRIYSLTGTQKPGNILTNPEKPYRYILDSL